MRTMAPIDYRINSKYFPVQFIALMPLHIAYLCLLGCKHRAKYTGFLEGEFFFLVG